MYNPPLEKIKVAAHCKANWFEMYGNDRVRFCSQCNKNVYNLSAMTRLEAENLIVRTEGRLCARFYRRKDGTILTQDCPVGLRALKDRAHRIKTHVFGALMSLFTLLGMVNADRLSSRYPGSIQGDISVEPKVEYPAEFPVWPEPRMGQIAIAPKTVKRSESFIRERAAFKVTPAYPFTGSSHAGYRAIVKVIISEDGLVETAEFIKGNLLLKGLAEDAVRRWQFKPLVIDGQPVRIESTLTFQFERYPFLDRPPAYNIKDSYLKDAPTQN